MKKALLTAACAIGAIACMADLFSTEGLKKEGTSIVDQQKAILNNEKQKVQDDIQKQKDALKAKPEAEKQKLIDAQKQAQKDVENKVLEQEKKGVEKVNETEKKFLFF